MQQLTIFDALNELDSLVEIIPRQGIIKNQVSIYYKGIHVANARDCRNGLYEFRPRVGYFHDSKIRTMNKNEIVYFCERH